MDKQTESALASGRTFCWHELYVGNSQAGVDFYTKVLDWGVQEWPMGELGVYKMFVANGQPVAGVMGTSEVPNLNEVPPHWATYIAVDDVDARLEKWISGGGSLIHGPMDIPEVGRMAVVQDPQGAVAYLFKGLES